MDLSIVTMGLYRKRGTLQVCRRIGRGWFKVNWLTTYSVKEAV